MVNAGSGRDRLTFLQNKLEKVQNEYDDMGVRLDNVHKFDGETSDYSDEATHQKSVLSP